jgi:hypothetical protein
MKWKHTYLFVCLAYYNGPIPYKVTHTTYLLCANFNDDEPKMMSIVAIKLSFRAQNGKFFAGK